jgi:hypothetical protein
MLQLKISSRFIQAAGPRLSLSGAVKAKILNFKKGYKQKRGRSCFVRTRRVSAFPGKKTPAGKSHGRLDILFAFRRAVS